MENKEIEKQLHEAIEALEILKKAFIIAVGDKSPFAKEALKKAEEVIKQYKNES